MAAAGGRVMLGGLFRGRRLETSFSLGTALLVVVVVASALAVVRGRLVKVLHDGMADRGYSVAKSIGAVSTPSLLAYNYVALQTAAENAVEGTDLAYVVIHDKEGVVAGSAGVAGANPDGLPEFPAEVTGPTVRRLPLPKHRATEVFEAIVPVYVEGSSEPWGYVRVGQGFDEMRAELGRLTSGVVVLGVLLVFFGIAVGRFMARRIAAPLRILVDGTEALSYGDTSYRIPVGGSRELAELAQSFNRMMDRVQEKADESKAFQSELERLNATLEEQVRRRTRELEESEAQYRTLVEHSPDPILIVQNGRVRFFSRAFQETFGVTASDVENPVFELENLFVEDCREVVRARLEAWQKGQVMSPAVVTATDAHGQPRKLELRGSRIEYLGKSAAECLLVDMTETQRLRDELEDTQRLRSLGELSSGVAHDFNNLLGAILGRIQLLRKRDFGGGIDDEMAVIEKAAQDGRETVRRIQEFSRTRVDRPFEPVKLVDILTDAIEITRSRWKTESERRNVRVEVRTEFDDAPPVMGSATELREVFTNLILNAADAMPQGGDLTLRCYRHEGRVRAEVEDSGVGMTEEIRRHLFDPFFTTKGTGGTGLGMSVAYGIVTRHDGTIHVKTALNKGTRFTLSFPACAEVSEDEAGKLDAPGRPARPASVLVIDDEPAIAELIEDTLTLEGHRVQVATSGTEGMNLAAAGDFDLVLSDLGMPDMSGWEVASRLRAQDPELPVLLVTGWGTTIDEEAIEEGGVAGVVHKPFEIRELVDAVHRQIERRRRGQPVG